MSDSFGRLELMVADLHPTDEADLAKAELVASLKRELASLRSSTVATTTRWLSCAIPQESLPSTCRTWR
jgi:hypothetical protein